MKLYHGTTEAIARLSLKDGLKPRSVTKKSNWKHSVESNPALVYLTNTYAPYYAMCSLDNYKNGSGIGIVEIDTDYLDEDNFRPDEDFIEQASAKDERFPVQGSMEKRTKWINRHIDEFSHHWEKSITYLGNCAYKGAIPKQAITRVSIAKVRKCKTMIGQAMNPCIVLANFQFCSKQYQTILKWFMGEKVSVDEWFNSQLVNPLPLLNESQRKEALSGWSKVLPDQSMIEVIQSK